jgi:hypothetical protein
MDFFVTVLSGGKHTTVLGLVSRGLCEEEPLPEHAEEVARVW